MTSWPSRPRIVYFLFACALAAPCPGCGRPGPPTGEVAGKVTFRGAPVEEGTVTLYNAETGFTAEASLGAGGTFGGQGPWQAVPVGTYRVTVTPPMYLDSSDPKTPPVMMEKKVRNIPELYRRDGTTPLTAEVKEGKNELTFDLVPG